MQPANPDQRNAAESAVDTARRRIAALRLDDQSHQAVRAARLVNVLAALDLERRRARRLP